MIRLKRAYDKPSKQDGLRILVERLWPRGVSKDKGAIDLWLKDLAPQHGTAEVVRSRPGEMGRIPQTVLDRA
jgi:uncharacterized protein YeaO (DUF488 family)